MRALFAVEYYRNGEWVLNTYPVFKNWQYWIHTSGVPVSIENLPYKPMPSLLDDRWVLASMVPRVDKRVPQSTSCYSLPEDMDPLSMTFLDKNAKYQGTLYLKDFEKYNEEILSHHKVKMTVYTSKELVEKYKEDGELPTTCFEFTSGKYNQPVEVRVDLSRLSGQLLYMYQILPEDLRRVFATEIKDPYTDVRVLFTVL